MPKTAEQFQEIKDERRNRILVTSLRLFAVRGYDSTTISDITAAASCSHGLFYHYFASKEEVFQVLIDNSLEKGGLPDMSKRFDQEKDSPTFIMKMSISWILSELEKQDSDFPYYLYIFLNIHFQKTIPTPRKMKSDRKHPFFVVRDLVKRGQDMGEFEKGNPNEYAMSLFALLRGITYVRVTTPEDYHAPSVDIIMNLFLRKERS
ncbi:MAG: TetR/AcrR family transcriptional regulator [Firmicutes bacterium]|nr:TetR/AcrR family transcriptional regulator [Bacillota bacterium]